MSFNGGKAGVCPLCGGSQGERIYSREFQNVTWHLGKCPDCGLHYTDPKPTPAQMAGFYEGDYHSELRSPGGSERAFGEKFRRYVEWIVQFVQKGRSLDIGCATGLMPHLLSRGGFAAEGVEFNPQSAAWGREHYGVPITVGGLEQVDALPGAFDLVTMTDVLEHTENPVEALRGVNALLRQGGFMLVTFPDISSLRARFSYLLARAASREWLWMSCHIPGHTWEFTPATARKCFEKAGFEVAGFRRSESVPDEWSGMMTPLGWWERFLNWGPVARRQGSQMEFMLRKVRPGA